MSFGELKTGLAEAWGITPRAVANVVVTTVVHAAMGLALGTLVFLAMAIALLN